MRLIVGDVLPPSKAKCSSGLVFISVASDNERNSLPPSPPRPPWPRKAPFIPGLAFSQRPTRTRGGKKSDLELQTVYIDTTRPAKGENRLVPTRIIGPEISSCPSPHPPFIIVIVLPTTSRPVSRTPEDLHTHPHAHEHAQRLVHESVRRLGLAARHSSR